MPDSITPAQVDAAMSSPLIFQKMPLILADVGAIGKGGWNDKQKFKFRGIDQCYAALYPLLSKHKVFMASSVLSTSREERKSNSGGVLAFTCIHMRYRFYAEDGSFVETDAYGEGMDAGDKSSNKAMAVAHKYAILQAFCIPTEDVDDPDKETHEVAARGSQESPEDYVAKASDWINSQMDADAIHRGWTAEMDGFHKLPKPLQDKLQAVRDERLRFLSGNAEKPDEREAWANKQIAWIDEEPGLQAIQKFWKDNAKLIAGLEPYQLAPLERAKEAAKRRIAGMSGPKVHTDKNASPIILDDQVPF